MYFRLLNASLGTDFDPDYGNFTIISRKVRDAFLRFRDKDRHYLMILRWLGYDHASIDVAHAERYAGESAYTLGTLIRFAIDGLFFQSTTLLRWSTYVGFAASLGGVILAGFFVVNYFLENTYPGWTSLAVLILLIGGLTITTVGVAGLYIGKIFTQVKDRPLYVVDVVEDRRLGGSVHRPVRRARDGARRSCCGSAARATDIGAERRRCRSASRLSRPSQPGSRPPRG